MQGHAVPIVALTANAMKGFERELTAAGFDGFLTKPIDVDALLRDLAGRLGGQAGEAAAAAAPATVPADTGALVSRLATHARLGPIAQRFAMQLPARLLEMDEALARGDMAALAMQAHSLKGAGGSMGYDELFEPARELEERAKADDAAAVAAVITDLHALAARISLGATIATQELDEVGA